MTNTSAELSQGNNGGASIPPPNSQPGPPEHQPSRGSGNNAIFKSGPLFISSKGIGWTSWKKRWFILTQTSLVFFRSDPNAVPLKGNEVNLTLGGIDLNNSGSVIVKADKKLLTVQFPDGHDGRAFTLKAETTDDLYEWKIALEKALAQAPSAANASEQNVKDREPAKSTVIGRPILLALEDADGTPSFLEKALKFMEEHGASVEGILRQAADVDDVERRVREYEQGKTEFAPDEDAHVIGDCIKHVIRGLPSSPVPASCCKALLEACRTERGVRVASMRAAINDTFPEPNRRLLQRILLMMQTVASQKAVNRMSSSAVAACMAPLLLRPLLAGECEIDNDFDVGGDGSVQLLQAAAAANHAQAIVITLLEEYTSIFGEGSVSPDIYTDSEESGSESEEGTDDDLSYDDDDDDYDDESVHESDEDDLVSESYTETGDSEADDYDDKDHDHSHSSSKSSDASDDAKVNQMITKSREGSPTEHENTKSIENLTSPKNAANTVIPNKPVETSPDLSGMHNSYSPSQSHMKKSATMSNGPAPRHRNMLGRTSARKNLSMESIDFPLEEDDEIERLEVAKTELQNQIADEVKENEKMQSKIDDRKKDLQERRLALEQDVAKLQEQLHKEKSSRATETRVELQELALVEVDLSNLERMVEELGQRLNVKLEHKYRSTSNVRKTSRQLSNQERKMKHKGDADVSATSQYERSMSKDSYLSGGESDSERKAESTPLQNKQPPTSKRSTSRGEGANTSALTKLTSRLNFLKVGRSQAVNELQNADRGRDSSHSSRNQDKGKGSERHQALPSPRQNPEKGRVMDSSKSLEKGSSKGKSHQSSEKLRKSDSQPGYHSEGWDQHPTYLERGRSEGHHQSFNVDKGR
ncbi:rho GTPase-activating protein REN1-like isoform X4 [Vicia villosa]|uniref:rho GTPase-activating protein REN1-like isoform X3 n=1 Tax=Vicia villosa TaxID=3911 RepID=UPI00273B3813|nr:rho GTPase-activating protein REN1-like isoform X3 [Vicia villosa]XP_058781221.1 rho GTPase-activating protein REN1-like isoform X4 [Vicia villosa]